MRNTKFAAFGLPAAIANVTDVVFNPVSGEVSVRDGSGSKLEFKAGTRVRIVVRDVNPFVYRYAVEAAGTKVVEANAAAFFVSVFGASGVVGADGNPPPFKTEFVSVTTLSECDSLAVSRLREIDKTSRASQLVVDLRESWSDYDRALAQLQGQYLTGVRKMRDPSAAAPAVATEASRSVQTLDNIVVRVKSAESATDSKRNELAAIIRNGAPPADSLARAVPKCLAAVQLAKAFRGYEQDSVVFAAAAKAAAAVRTTALEAAFDMAATSEDPLQYYYVHDLGPATSPTDYEVTISRRFRKFSAGQGTIAAPEGEKETVVRFSLNIGGRGRFSIAAGVAGSALPDRQYKATWQRRPPAAGIPRDSVRVVSQTEASAGRWTPMLFLNTNLLRWGGDLGLMPSELNLSLGLGPRTAEKISAELFVGAGLGLVGGRVTLAAGAYFGRSKRLADGLAVGEEVPVSDDAPAVQNFTSARIGFALGIRTVP